MKAPALATSRNENLKMVKLEVSMSIVALWLSNAQDNWLAENEHPQSFRLHRLVCVARGLRVPVHQAARGIRCPVLALGGVLPPAVEPDRGSAAPPANRQNQSLGPYNLPPLLDQVANESRAATVHHRLFAILRNCAVTVAYELWQ